jgi:hypothetical protein
MKKIFTLLFAVGLVTLAQAQPGRGNHQNDSRDFDKNVDISVNVNHNPYNNNDDRYGNNSFGNERRLRMKIAEINREYDYKIQKVRNNFFHNRWEKQRMISQLENQRDREIRMAYARLKNNRYDRDYPNRRY